MIDKTCDMCGATAERLVDFDDRWKTKHIKEICRECVYRCNDHLDRLGDLSTKIRIGRIRQFLMKLAGQNKHD